MSAGSATIVPARGDLDDARAREASELLVREEGLSGEASRRWLSELVCLAIEDGHVVGLGIARPATVALIGGRPFWLYRSVLARHSGELWNGMFNAAFDLLAEEFQEPDGPYIGLCALIEDPAEMKRRPQAVWPETELMYAGYLDDGRQVRLRYFWGAAIGPGLPNSPSLDRTRQHEYPLEAGYRIVPLEQSPVVEAEDVFRFWQLEGALEIPEEGSERIRDVRLVATGPDRELAGV